MYEKTVALEDIPGRVRELIQEFVDNRLAGETFTSYWGRTHVNGAAPTPDQFHVEFALRGKTDLVAMEA
jgi:hypothetical protein